MNLALICVGKLKEDYIRSMESDLKRVLNKNHRMEIIEVPDESIPKKAGVAEEEKVKEKEGCAILSHIKNDDYVISLCIDGKMFTSEKLSSLLRKIHSDERYKRIVFIIGGSLGLNKAVIKKSDCYLSFSNMTFPHQLMRIMLLETLSKI